MKTYALIIVLTVGVLMLAWTLFFPMKSVTTSLLSPDDTMRAVLIERRAFLDRNFDVNIEDLRRNESITIFSSPDEGLPIGSERFIWSSDGSCVLLVGRHFYTKPTIAIGSGEVAYLLIDCRSGRIWSNAEQRPDLERITEEQVHSILEVETSSIGN